MQAQVAGSSTREHLKIAAKGNTPGAAKAREMLAKDEMRCPVEWLGVWRGFQEMDRWRGAGGMGGASPLSLQDVESWQRLYGVTLLPHEVDVVKRLDFLKLNAMHAASSSKAA